VRIADKIEDTHGTCGSAVWPLRRQLARRGMVRKRIGS